MKTRESILGVPAAGAHGNIYVDKEELLAYKRGPGKISLTTGLSVGRTCDYIVVSVLRW